MVQSAEEHDDGGRASIDPITELPDRVLFTQLLEHDLVSHPDTNIVLTGVSFDNLDQFEHALAVSAIDEVVYEMAAKLESASEQYPAFEGLSPVAARIGHDRFALLVCGWPEDWELETWGDRLHSFLAQPLEIDDSDHYPVVSVGLVSVAAGETAPSVLARLDSALSVAKAKSTRVTVAEVTTQDGIDSLRLHNDLFQAVERGQIEVWYQPQVRAAGGAVVGFEALVRWRHPERGLIPPVRFIPLAEESGLIVPLGEHILRTACATAATWGHGLGAPRVAVNLAPLQFTDPRLPDVVRDALAASGLEASRLELEVTESTAMLDLERTLAICGALKDLGVTLAIDDFGTGYSSLAYLKRFPLDILKIDQSFIRQITEDYADQAIVKALIMLAHALDLETIAEGVETEEQETVLGLLDCDIVQGYLHGRPMPAAEAASWLAAR